MNIRRFAVAGLIVTAVGLNACSSDSKQSLAGDTSTSSSVVETSSTVSAELTTVPATVAPETTPAPTAAPETAPPATPAPTATPSGYSLYDEVPGPNVPTTHTDSFASSGVLADGVYWADYLGGETLTPSIEIREAYFGEECTTQAAADSDECNNDIYIRADPSHEIDDLPFADDVFLTIADVNTQKSYWITPDELRTVRAGSPSVDSAPDGVYIPFAYLLTVQGGKIVKFEQVWTP
ncbi:MAG: hypothetical protein ABMA25_10650 [Ilumatobacteraceae bacterium]